MNYLVRLRVTTHVTTAIVARLPIPTPTQAGADGIEIAFLAGRLAVSVDPVAIDRLNARVARLYELDELEFSRVLETFPLVERARRDAALGEFHRLA